MKRERYTLVQHNPETGGRSSTLNTTLEECVLRLQRTYLNYPCAEITNGSSGQQILSMDRRLWETAK